MDDQAIDVFKVKIGEEEHIVTKELKGCPLIRLAYIVDADTSDQTTVTRNFIAHCY